MKQPTQFIDTKREFFFIAYICKLHKLWLPWCSLLTYFLLISPLDPHLSWQLDLGIHFCICSILPLVLSVLLFFLCGEDQIERVRRQFKGQTQVPASRAFTSALTESRVNHWEMFHRSRHIMQPSESHIKLFTCSIIASLLLSSTPADKSATLGPLESLTTQNVSFN